MVEDADSKRVNYSSRTVIGADPTLKLNQLGVPIEICRILTKPHIVTSYNIDKLTKLVNEGKANSVTRTFRKRDENGKEVGPEIKRKSSLVHAINKKGTEIYPGDIIAKRDVEIKLDLSGKAELPPNYANDPNFTIVKVGNEAFNEGDKIIRNGKIINAVLPTKKDFRLQIGDVVDVHLQAGDIISFNRQPSSRIAIGSFLEK
jgi:DNA-directed RNA polymerase beta' subunit